MEPRLDYQLHLERVSRSFAFCIPLLEPRLRNRVALAYLLFRVIDTIEDSAWKDSPSQKASFQDFVAFIKAIPKKEVVDQWVLRFPDKLPAEERLLLEDTFALLSDLHDLPLKVLKILQQSLIEMIQGMVHFAVRPDSRLNSLQELNQYCFFVAGIVGELLTSLMLERPLSEDDQDILLKSHHFGLFLQKINILKDQAKDETEKRFFVPQRRELFSSLKLHAEFAFEYIMAIPADRQDYKLFCAYSFYLALFSIPYIESSWLMKMSHKIPRSVTERCLSDVRKHIGDNAQLKELFIKNSATLIDLKVESLSPDQDLSWFEFSYGRKLTPEHLLSLGIIT